MPAISGKTVSLPIIGRPTTQVKSPEFFNNFFREKGIDAVTTAVELDDDAADAFIRAVRGWTNAAGFVATIPHKQRSAAACDRLSDRGRFLGAVNLIRREADGSLTGDMTDGLGCVAAMRSHGVEPKGKRAYVIGAGGAGSAIAHALCEAGVSRLGLTDLDATRAETLARRLGEAFPGVAVAVEAPDFAGVEIAVNASPAGMNGDPNLPAPLDGIPAGALVADVVTDPEMTPWLTAAKAKGCIVQLGREMVAGQFEAMVKHFGFPLD